MFFGNFLVEFVYYPQMFIKGFLLVVLTITISLFFLFRPSYVSQLYCQGPMRIQRDEYGIATLHVNSINQYLFGLGTVYAEDRLFQLTFRTYLVQGRLSEFVGPRLLDHDKHMHQLNLKGWADRRVERMFQQNRSEYEGYRLMAEGFNQRVATMTVLPLDFYLTGIKWQNFTVNHLFYLEILLEWGISMNLFDQYKRSLLLKNFTKQEIDWILPNKKENWAFDSVPIVLDEEIPDHLRTQNLKHRLQKIRFDPLSVERPLQLEIIQVSKQFDATNVLVVSGNHTQSGLPLLVNDPHLENIIPSQWYLLKVNYTRPDGRTILIAGGLVVGGITIIGQNGYYIMGASICHSDNQDLFREKVEGDKYLLDGTWRDLKIRNEVIYVKTPEGLIKQEIQVRQTHRGPIISYIYGNGGSIKIVNDSLSIAWTGFNSQWEDSMSFMRIYFSQNVEDVKNYLQNSTLTIYNINILTATRDNHIFMQQSGLNPLRRNPQSGTYIKDGSTTFHDWVGIVPNSDLMHLVDPPKGYIINSNNRVGQSGYYGGYLDYNTYTARADRIDELVRAEIQSGRKIGAEFMRRVMYDTVDIYCRKILPQILDVVEEARPFLGSFDCNFTSNSYQATIYEVFFLQIFYQIRPIVFEKIPFLSSYFMQQGIYNYIHFAFKGDQSKKQTLKAAWSNTFPYLQNHFKSKDYSSWSWGKLHVDKTRHIPFRNVPWLSYFYDLQFPGSGNQNTPNMGKMEKQDFGNFQTTHRPVIRMIHGFGEDQNYWCVDSGQSEHVTSSHYSDQWKLFIRNELIPINLDKVKFGSEL